MGGLSQFRGDSFEALYIKEQQFQPHVDGTDDAADWAEVLEAMEAMKLSPEDKYEIVCTTAAVLHLGNIEFVEQGTEVAALESQECEWTVTRSLCVNLK